MPTNDNEQEQEQELLDTVTARASVDAEFRKKLIADAGSAIHETFGIEVPSTLAIRFVEKAPGVDAMYVLPDFIRPEGELSEYELEAVAGGMASGCVWTCVCSSTNVQT